MIIAHPTFTPSRTLLYAAVFAFLTGLSFTSEITAQEPPVPALAAAAPVAVPTAAAPNAPTFDYSPATDRLDQLYPNGVVATIGNRSITVAEVRREVTPLIPSLQRNVHTQEEFNGKLTLVQNETIKYLVDRAMLIQQFHDRREGEPPRHIEPAWIDAQIAEEQEKRFGGDPQKFLEHLQQRGQTMSDYRKDVEEGIIVSYMRAQEKKVAARTDVPKTPEPERPLHLRIIQLNRTSGETDAVLLEKANAILERLKQGEAFGQLATEFDQSGRRARGGDWGWLGAADFKATFRDVAMALQKGAVSAPIITPDGCFLLYAEDRR